MLIGQTVDCYLSQPAANALGNFPGAESFGTPAQSNCWYTPDSAILSAEERLAGLGSLVLRIVALYVLGSILTGATFYSMSWTGQHVLRAMREDVLQHLLDTRIIQT